MIFIEVARSGRTLVTRSRCFVFKPADEADTPVGYPVNSLISDLNRYDFGAVVAHAIFVQGSAAALKTAGECTVIAKRQDPVAKPSGEQFVKLFRRIDAIPELTGAGVAYVGDLASTTMRPSAHTSGLQTYVVLSESASDERSPQSGGTTAPPSLAAELVGLGLNCGSAVLAWTVVSASGAAAPLTGGASTVAGIIVWGATIASTLQCANSIIRSIDVVRTGGEWTEYLDSQEWYEWAGKIADGFSLAGVGVSVAGTTRAVLAIRAATGRSWKEVLQGLSRAERKRLTKELMRMQNKGASNAQIKALIRAGTFPKRFAAEEISTALFRQLRDAIGATLAFTGSALSGDVKALYVSIFQE